MSAIGFLTRPAMWPLSHGQWSPSDRIVYADQYGMHTVEPGERVDGASIPRLLWPLIGHPLTTDYVYPSAIHDVQCVARVEDPRVVHRRFYDALRCEGVRHTKARIMYLAVLLFGPWWGDA